VSLPSPQTARDILGARLLPLMIDADDLAESLEAVRAALPGCETVDARMGVPAQSPSGARVLMLVSPVFDPAVAAYVRALLQASPDLRLIGVCARPSLEWNRFFPLWAAHQDLFSGAVK
jgi:hypothetical protein